MEELRDVGHDTALVRPPGAADVLDIEKLLHAVGESRQLYIVRASPSTNVLECPDDPPQSRTLSPNSWQRLTETCSCCRSREDPAGAGGSGRSCKAVPLRKRCGGVQKEPWLMGPTKRDRPASSW